MMDQRHSEASNALCTQRLSDNVRHGKMDAAKSVTMQDSEHVENGVDIANVTSNKPDIQVKLFDLQLRMHIQFCAQSILQVMHHPYLGHHISLWLNFLVSDSQCMLVWISNSFVRFIFFPADLVGTGGIQAHPNCLFGHRDDICERLCVWLGPNSTGTQTETARIHWRRMA